MTEIVINSKRFVISRQRNEKVELVGEDGEIVSTDSYVSQATSIERGVVPGAIPFVSRPRSFLSELRLRREIDMSERIKTKRRAKSSPSQPRIKRKSQKSLASEAAATLPFDLAAIMKSKGVRK